MSLIRPELKYLVPLKPRQRVMVLDEDNSAAADLQIPDLNLIAVLPAQSGEIHVGATLKRTTVVPHGLPLASASIDHVIISELTHGRAEWLLPETARVLRPGGWLCLGLHKAGWLHRLGLANGHSQHTNGHRTNGLALKACRGLLLSAGFVRVNTYGIARSAEDERFLIPLDQSGAARYFFQEAMASTSRLAPMARIRANVMTAAGLQHFLFKHMAVLAQRAPIPD